MDKKKKIVVFSGAGLDVESGIETFRDIKNGLWYNYNVDEVATIQGWNKNPTLVLEFHNMLRKKLPSVEPNDAHKLLVGLEDEFDVIHVTQNVTDLLERAGASNVIHLHGELTKARKPRYPHKTTLIDEIFDIGYEDINLGDLCPVNGTQIRPHTVLFGEYPYGMEEAHDALNEADILVIIGTTLQISYTPTMINSIPNNCQVFFIDPDPSKVKHKVEIQYIKKTASDGLKELVTILSETKNV